MTAGSMAQTIMAISTNTLLAEGDQKSGSCRRSWSISTNTLLAEGDCCQQSPPLFGLVISTNTLLAEGDVHFFIKNA